MNLMLGLAIETDCFSAVGLPISFCHRIEISRPSICDLSNWLETGEIWWNKIEHMNIALSDHSTKATEAVTVAHVIAVFYFVLCARHRIERFSKQSRIFG